MEDGSESIDHTGEGGRGVISGRTRSLDRVEKLDDEEAVEIARDSCPECSDSYDGGEIISST